MTNNDQQNKRITLQVKARSDFLADAKFPPLRPTLQTFQTHWRGLEPRPPASAQLFWELLQTGHESQCIALEEENETGDKKKKKKVKTRKKTTGRKARKRKVEEGERKEGEEEVENETEVAVLAPICLLRYTFITKLINDQYSSTSVQLPFSHMILAISSRRGLSIIEVNLSYHIMDPCLMLLSLQNNLLQETDVQLSAIAH